MSSKIFEHKSVENKWQEKWLKDKIFYPDNINSTGKNKYYSLWMFPYPSAEGLHAGHAFASTGSDVISRYRRMQGKEVFQPIGYDSFGIHSENFALNIKEHPKEMLDRTTRNYERQLKSLGHGYDWTRTVTTSDIDYYRWTQWLFVQMFKAGLAYRAKSNVNWCPSCKTVLADEQIINEECERCQARVEIRELKQWFFRITDYADGLLKNLEKINWPNKIKLAQRNWIGKKEGIDIEYEVEGIGEKVICWTSRLDTNFGATFVVLAPEHPLAIKLTTDENRQKVSEYIKISQKKNNKEKRIREEREKTGVFTGSFAINNLNDYKMPIWISDFVLAGIGTGAVVGVPGHDRRDFEFAQKYKIPIVRVVVGSDEDKSDITKIEQVQEEEGKMINSQLLNGMDIRKATEKMMNYMEEKGWGKQKTTYHLRDWLISRQRYWGPPIPMIYCESCAKSGKSYFSERGSSLLHEDQSGWENAGWYPEENLPVELPYYEDYKPKGGGTGPLDDHPDFYETSCPKCGGEAKRETDVSDTFLDSAWYFLRYPSVGSETCSNKAFDPTITEKWLPVDIYFGGAEHAVLHLMYARFIWHVLRDMGYLDFSSHGQPPSGWDEPFPDFFAHGLVIKDGVKMSKSRGNTVNPDEYIEKFGADTLRLYLMFMGPMDGYPDFRDTGIEGMRRFIDRVWSLFNEHLDIVVVEKDDKKKILIKMHQTINKVTKDIEKFRYNTAISSIMEYVNLLRDIALRSKKADEKTKRVEWEDALKTLALVLAPFTPHMAEEVWVERLNRKYSIHKTAWPGFDKNLIREKALTIIVQVNGKLRATITVDNDKANDEKFVTNLARRNEKISPWLEKGVTSDAIFVPGKLVNFVVV